MTLRTSVLALAFASAVALPARADEASATEHFKRGRALLSQGKAAEALKELETSYADLQSPNTELLIAHAHRELGDRVRAFAEYQATRAAAAASSSRYREAEEEAARWTEKLRNELGHLIVVAPNGSTATLSDGVRVALQPHGDMQQGELWHDPGPLKVVVFDDTRRITRKLSLTAGATETVVVATLGADPVAAATDDHHDKPDPDTTRPKPGSSAVVAPSIVTGAVALGALGVAIGFGLSAKNEFDTVNAKCPQKSGTTKCPYPNLQSIADNGATHQTLANVLFGVAGVAAATSIVLGVALNVGGDGPKTKPRARSLELGVGAAQGGFGVAARGAFQ